MKNYYEILGVENDSTDEEIKKAYRRLVIQCHPDHNQSDAESEARLRELNEAYEILKSPIRRRRYDQFGDLGIKTGVGGIDDLLQDFMSDVFGGPFKKKQKGHGNKGADLRYILEIDFEECALGCEKRIQYLRKHSGVETKSSLIITVPAGAAHGQRLRIQGAGDSLSDASKHGDLFVVVHLKPHPLFVRKGNDVHMQMPVTISEAVLGCTKLVPTLYGSKLVDISPATPFGSKIRLKDSGFTELKSMGRGLMVIDIVLDMPQKLSLTEKKLYEQLGMISKSSPLIREFEEKCSALLNKDRSDAQL